MGRNMQQELIGADDAAAHRFREIRAQLLGAELWQRPLHRRDRLLHFCHQLAARHAAARKLGWPVAHVGGTAQLGADIVLDVARQVAARTQPFGQDAVQLIGPSDQPVTRVCIGTGVVTPLLKFIDDYQADLAICTDDGLIYWRDAALAIDIHLPVIVVNHAVSELAGIASLASRLQAQFPQLPVHYLPQKCMYRLVTV